jgi:hypothetical protein
VTQSKIKVRRIVVEAFKIKKIDFNHRPLRLSVEIKIGIHFTMYNLHTFHQQLNTPLILSKSNLNLEFYKSLH